MQQMRRTLLSAAVAAALGNATPVPADIIDLSFGGGVGAAWFTMIQPDGSSALANGDAADNAMRGWRTDISGRLRFDSDRGTASVLTTPFSFFGVGMASITSFSLQAVGDGKGGPGSLMLGNMGMNWGGDAAIPISLVLDAAGLYQAMESGVAVSGLITGGIAGASEDFRFKSSYTLPMGPGPLTTTVFNTSAIGNVTLNDFPSGTLPLSDDGIAGSPMLTGPLSGFNASFDFLALRVDACTPTGPHLGPCGIIVDPPPVPLPATLWLFGPGLAGLAWLARRRRKTS